MSKLIVRSFSISLDGYGAGTNQSFDNPLGVNGSTLHKWLVATKTFQTMFGQDGGEMGIDNDFAARGFKNIGAWIIGRNMFGPVREAWPDDTWKGWWGDNPPYHTPVFVLTHYARTPLVMEGGTTFYFVTDGIEAALQQARNVANGKEIRLGGGVSTIQQYLRAGLADELHITMSPVFLGAGENLFSGLNLLALGYECIEQVSTTNAIHLTITKSNR
jgi:dihydrofolate reductase